MDNSGKNRYELLFMDDDIIDPLVNIVKKRVKQPPHPAAVVSSSQQPKGVINKQNIDNVKKSSQLWEKENKSLAMNKNFDSKKSASNNATSVNGGNGSVSKTLGVKSGQQQSSQISSNNQNTNRSNREINVSSGGGRNNIKQQNGETREQRNNRRNRENGVQGLMGDYQNDAQQRIRQNNQRFGGPPRNRSGAEGVRIGKREFDRQSGSDKTGVKAVDKRDGAGAHNWGSVKQDIEDINKSTEEGLTDKEESATDQTAEQNVPVEEETKELTLDEWKAQRQQRAKPQYNIRKAGEGEDVTQWKKMIALNNKKKEGDSEEELEYDPSMYPQRVGRLQRVLDIQFHFNDGRRGGGGMGRGRGRGPRITGGTERTVGGLGGNGPVSLGGRADGLRVHVGRARTDNPRRDVAERQQRGGQHAPKEGDSEEELEYDPSMYPQRVGRLQHVLDIQFHFNDGRRGGGWMGRGRGRGPRITGGIERTVGGLGGNGSVSLGSRADGLRVHVGRTRTDNPRREGDSEEELEYDPSMYPKRVGRLQRVLDIQFHFNDGRRGGGWMRRGRGRGPRITGGIERTVGGLGGNGSVSLGSRADGPRVHVGRTRTDNPRRDLAERQQRRGQHAPKVDDEHTQFHFNDGRRGGGEMGRGRGRGPRITGGIETTVSGLGGNGPVSLGSRSDGLRVHVGRTRTDNPRRDFAEGQQRKGQHAPKVDDERQFPTLS